MIKRISLMRQVHQPDINTDADPNEKSRHCFAVAPNAIYYVLPTCIIYILAKANEKKHQEDEILYKKKKSTESVSYIGKGPLRFLPFDHIHRVLQSSLQLLLTKRPCKKPAANSSKFQVRDLEHLVLGHKYVCYIPWFGVVSQRLASGRRTLSAWWRAYSASSPCTAGCSLPSAWTCLPFPPWLSWCRLPSDQERSMSLLFPIYHSAPVSTPFELPEGKWTWTMKGSKILRYRWRIQAQEIHRWSQALSVQPRGEADEDARHCH